MSMNTEQDFTSQDTVIMGNSRKDESINEFIITFSNFLTENSSTEFPYYSGHIEFGDVLKRLLNEQGINF